MAEINLLRRYPRAKRNIGMRTVAQSAENIRIAREYGREYFDGSRDTGYGGYRYDGRWLPVARDIVAHFGLGRGDRVLDVGCGLGYSSAVLARLAGSVVALEEDAALARQAQVTLAANGAGDVEVACGPLTKGWPAAAPYDVILLNGATEIAPESLAGQLTPGGRLVCMFGRGPVAKGTIFRLAEGRLVGRSTFDAGAPLLPGFIAPPAFVF